MGALMKSWLRSGPGAPEEPSPPMQAERPATDAQALVRSLAQPVSRLGRDAAEVRGALEDTQKVIVAQREAMQALELELQQVQRAQSGIAAATAESIAAVARAREALHKIGAEAGGGVGVVADAGKDLATQVEQSSKSIMGTVGALDARIDSFSRELSSEGR